VLECIEPSLEETFLVFANDVAARIATLAREVEWADVIATFDDWQGLFAARSRLTPESELGLWAEVWFILQSAAPDRVASSWVGPDMAPVDFLLDGIGVEIKASQTRLAHFVSQTQVDRPIGDHESVFLSLWVGIDPVGGERLPVLVDAMLLRLEDPVHALKNLLLAGYTALDRELYSRPFMLLEPPAWFSHDTIPRVRSADPGVSRLRYLVELNPERQLSAEETARLRGHFGLAEVAKTRTATSSIE
jgi:hypothetical protein